jgi:hypothetical protein
MKADRILFRDGVLQREAKILFTEPGGPWNTVLIYESDDPRKRRIGKIREDRRHSLLTIDGDAKDFATEVFSSVGKDWMKGENHGT